MNKRTQTNKVMDIKELINRYEAESKRIWSMPKDRDFQKDWDAKMDLDNKVFMELIYSKYKSEYDAAQLMLISDLDFAAWWSQVKGSFNSAPEAKELWELASLHFSRNRIFSSYVEECRKKKWEYEWEHQDY